VGPTLVITVEPLDVIIPTVLETAGFFSINKVDWTNLGLFFGFLSFIV
jgi:hypothetical protein